MSRHPMPRPFLPSLPTLSLLAATMGAAVAPQAAPVQAQEALRYTQTTTVELGGPMGAMAALQGRMAGVEEPVVEEVLIQGSRMRQDREGSTTLTDWEAGTVTFLDHSARTWRTVPVERLAGGAGPEAGSPEGQGEGDPREPDDAPSEPESGAPPGTDLGMSFRTIATGRTDTVAGYPARQVVFVLSMGRGLGVRTAMVTELWVSREFPASELMAEARDALAGGWTPDAMEGLLGRLGPELARAVQEQADAFGELEGTPLRVVSNMVMLPPEGEVEVEAVLATESLGAETEGLSDAEAAEAMRQRLQDLLRGAEGAEPIVTMRTRTEISDVAWTEVEPGTFDVPDGYAEAAEAGGRRG